VGLVASHVGAKSSVRSTWAVGQAPCSADDAGQRVGPSIRAKAVVDAELHSGDGLLDVNPWYNLGDTKNRSGQC
jgi:hypothetical protein